MRQSILWSHNYNHIVVQLAEDIFLMASEQQADMDVGNLFAPPPNYHELHAHTAPDLADNLNA